MSQVPIPNQTIPEPRAESASGVKTWSVGTLTYTTGGLVVLFCWMLWGDFAWMMKERSVSPVVMLLFSKFHASDWLTGLLVGSLPQAMGLLMGPVIAYKSDRHRGRWGRRIPYLLVSTPIVALGIIGLAFSPAFGGHLHGMLGPHSPGLDFIVLLCLGFFWTLFEFATIIANSVFGGLINDVVPHQVIGRFFGMFRALSLLAGIGFNYWLLGKAEEYYVWIFIGVAVLYSVGFLMVGLKVREGDYAPPPAPGPDRGVRGAVQAAQGYFKECFGIPYYWWYYAYIPLSWTAFSPVNLFSLFFARSIQMDMGAYGKCIALTYGISLALAYPLGALADRVHPLKLGLIMQAVYALVTLLGGLYSLDVSSFAIALVAQGVISGAWMTATASIGQRLLPRAQFAQFSSAGGIIGSLTGMLVGPAVGYILDQLHHVYRYTYYMSCAITVMAMLCGLVLYCKFKALGGPVHYVAPE